MVAAIIYKSTDSTAMELPERIAKLETQVEAIKDDVAELKNDVKEIHSRITTGNREIVEKLESMENRLESRMRDNSDTSGKQHREMQESLKREIEKISLRVAILENWRWTIVGAAAVLGYIMSHFEIVGKFLK
jgi:seryl-tRNA synthetase